VHHNEDAHCHLVGERTLFVFDKPVLDRQQSPGMQKKHGGIDIGDHVGNGKVLHLDRVGVSFHVLLEHTLHLSRLVQHVR